ncbi:DUF3987 domain-containing protein [Brevibacillus reuszeri]|uniref:phage NrS-1 polymerase family protein n=1 Tax=Brevibacillus reuszeri TaxID=54915 RepID=UPI002E2073A0|nr:DUF3987 domain-containing protein [Brevibacillus reuszeri]
MYTFANIPVSLREFKQWVLWGYRMRDSIKTKVPLNIAGIPSDAQDSDNQFTFEEVVHMYTDEEFNPEGKRFNGIGFVFKKDGGITGIDLDKCVDKETGKIEEWAQKIIDRFQSYTELSVSGTGVHILIEGKIPGAKNRTGQIEMYDSKRFFTVSGNRIGEVEGVMERQDVLNSFYKEVFPENEKLATIKNESETALSLSDSDIISLLIKEKNGGKWAKLYQEGWKNGESYCQKYPSQSEADAAFCSKLAFYTDDPEQIERIMSKSKLGQREKWENRHDYRDSVIQKALAQQTERYSGTKNSPSKSDSEGQADKVSETSEEWPDIVEFEEYELPEFPTDIFPDWVRDYVEAIAESSQTPVDMAGMLVLAALATCIQRRYVIEIVPEFVEPLCLYVLVAMPPSNRKTKVFSEIIRPIRRYEKYLRSEFEVMSDERKVEIDILKAKEDELKKRMKKGEVDVKHELSTIKSKIKTLQELYPPSLIKQDITAEGLIQALRQNQNRLGILSDESGVLDIASGLYTGGKTNIDIFLKGHTGSDYVYDRKGSEPAYLDRATITLGLAVQNEVLQEFVSKKVMRGRGFIARFLYSVPKSMVGYRKADGLPVPQHVKTNYDNNISKILEWKTGGTVSDEVRNESLVEFVKNEIEKDTIDYDEDAPPQYLCLTEEAQAVYKQFYEDHEPRLHPDKGDLGGVNILEWSGKLVGHLMRIAGLLHVAENIDKPRLPLAVEAFTVKRAIRLGDYLISHARKAFGEASLGNNFEKQKKLLLALLGKIPKEECENKRTKTDIWRLVKGKGFPNSADISKNLLDGLVERGYLRNEYVKRGGKGADSIVYMINPKVYEMTKESGD